MAAPLLGDSSSFARAPPCAGCGEAARVTSGALAAGHAWTAPKARVARVRARGAYAAHSLIWRVAEEERAARETRIAAIQKEEALRRAEWESSQAAARADAEYRASLARTAYTTYYPGYTYSYL